MSADRRKSNRKKCPVKRTDIHIVYFKSSSSDEDNLLDIKVNLKKYPCRIIRGKRSSVNAAYSKENVCPNRNAQRKNLNTSKDLESDESSSEEASEAKKYPTRNKVLVKKSPVRTSSSKRKENKVISEKLNTKRVSNKKTLQPSSNSKKEVSSDANVLDEKAKKNRISAKQSSMSDLKGKESSTTKAKFIHEDKHLNEPNYESNEISDDEVMSNNAYRTTPRRKTTIKKSSIQSSNWKENISLDDDTEKGHANKNESDETSDDEISDSGVTNHHVDTKTYPQRKRKGTVDACVDSKSNSLYKSALSKKMKSTLDDGINVKEDRLEASSSAYSNNSDSEQSESEVDQESVDMLPSVFDSSLNESADVDVEKESGAGNSEGKEIDNDEELYIEDDAEQENVVRARVLTSNTLDGQSIYGFVTPKRKDALAKIAQDAVESARKSSKKSSKKSSTSKNNDNHSKGAGRKTRNKVTLLKTLAANDSEDNDDEDDDGDDNEESSGGEESDGSPKKSQKKKDNLDLLDEYFEVHSKSKSLTSDKTLGKLKNPKMDQQELLKYLKEIQSSHVQEIVKLHNTHRCQYKNWMFNLLSGFNVLLYGFGSKRMLLEKFRKTMLKDQVHVIVNGFFPSIQLRQVLKTITEELLEKETSFKNTIEHYKYITKEYNTGTAGKLFIIIHNIDGPMLRSQHVQTALGHLASSKNIHVIASIDHISAPLIWDQNRSSAFNWLWYDTTTFEAYSEETSYENSLMVQQSGTLALSSLKHVLHSLTSNSKGIFKVLANYHMDNEDNTSYQGMSFGDLYQRCRERFLVNSDLTLRSQLTEFRDHKLIQSKKGFDGVEYLSVALDRDTLRIYLEEGES